MKKEGIIILVGLALFVGSCQKKQESLPYFGEEAIMLSETGGEEVVYTQIPSFKLINQYGDTITERDFDKHVYVADFFFTSCPTICPKMSSNMEKVQEVFIDQDVLFISHSIDPQDSVEVLHQYAEMHGAIEDKWHLVTGDVDEIYELAREYYVMATQDRTGSGAFIHDGSFLLIDQDKHIRGIYDGTSEDGTKLLIAGINQLLKE